MEYELQALAERMGGTLEGDPHVRIGGVAAVGEAGPGDLTFVSHRRFLVGLGGSRAGAVILQEGIEAELSIPRIRVADAYVGFLRALEMFQRPRAALFPPGCHPGASVDPSATLAEGVHVGANAVLGPGVVVGEGSVIGAGSVLMAEVSVGRDCLLYPHVVVREDCRLGDRVVLHPGVVVGADGFGYASQQGTRRKIPQIGRVVLEDDVEVGANSCIDRATTGTTLVRAGSKLDNLVQLGHNVVVGRDCVICAQTGVSGSTRIGDRVVIGGQTGVGGHLEIGDEVQVAARSGVTKSVTGRQVVAGLPARDHHEWRRMLAHQSRLERYVAELGELRRRLVKLEGSEGAEAATDD